MHDIIVLYGQPEDSNVFDAHYRDTHVHFVEKLAPLQGISRGHAGSEAADVSDVGDVQFDYHVLARMTYAYAEPTTSPQGNAAVTDLANFAHAGVGVLNITRDNG